MAYGFFMAMLIIMTIHFKTSNVKEISITWGLVCFVIIAFSGHIGVALLLGLSGYVVAWSIFSLANYLEESIFLRVFVLVFGMFALIKLPFVLVGIVANLFSHFLGVE